MKLSRKLTFLYIALNIAMFAILNTLGVSLMEQNYLDEKKNDLYEEATSISSEYVTSYYRREMNLSTLANQIKIVSNHINARIWVVNNNGLVIIDSSNTASYRSINILDIHQNYFNSNFRITEVIKGVFNETMLSVSYPVSHNYQVQGHIVLHTPIREITEKTTSFIDIINICLLVFNIVLLSTFVILHYMMIYPLNKLNHAALKYTQGDYSYPLKLKRQDEFGKLSNSIAYMANEISELDDYQKKFIGNISHDLRSPLTSIKGYAQALVDGTIPYEMKDKYLGIIIFETERLNKLTNDLLTLNKLDHSGKYLEIIEFDMNHIIKKTAESFEGVCKQKKITLQLHFASKETFIQADMGKIQQVLYNLLDNAIKFSHNNSAIKVTTTEKGEKVFVSVKDYGIGIPKESIKKVWERFYKSDSSRGKDKKGTGLGLSITKDIITAHGENINVISTEGVGSEFIFSLRKSLDFI